MIKDKDMASTFLEVLDGDYSIPNVMKALEEADKLCWGKLQHIKTEEDFCIYFYNSIDEEKQKANKNYDELLGFWDLFREFEPITRKERKKKWGCNPFIINSVLRLMDI